MATVLSPHIVMYLAEFIGGKTRALPGHFLICPDSNLRTLCMLVGADPHRTVWHIGGNTLAATAEKTFAEMGLCDVQMLIYYVIPSYKPNPIMPIAKFHYTR